MKKNEKTKPFTDNKCRLEANGEWKEWINQILNKKIQKEGKKERLHN